jgi:hypothetical protein
LTLQTDGFREAWGKWSEYIRARNGRKLTAHTLDLHMRHCEKVGPQQAIADITEGIARGWACPTREEWRQSRTPSPAQHQAATAQHRQAADAEAQRRAAERQAAEAQRQRDEQEWADWWGQQNQADVEAAVWSAVDIRPARVSHWRTMAPKDRYANLGFREAARRYAPRQPAVEFAAA